MGKKICPECNTIFDDKVLIEKESENCLVCGASLRDMDEPQLAQEENDNLISWYYYAVGKSSYYLDDVYMEDDENSKLVFSFKAPPRDENGDCDAAKEILRKKYDPTAFLESEKCTIDKPDALWIAEGKCPRCHSSNIQLVPRKFSIWTGFRTNKVDRMCVNCKHRF